MFGDYDVDGATSLALILRFCRSLGIATALHIPDRQKEGYGPNITGLRKLHAHGARLIITVDTGTLAFAPLAEASRLKAWRFWSSTTIRASRPCRTPMPW